MALVIETRSVQGTVTRTKLRSGATRLQVKAGDVFRLIDEETGKAPTKVIVKQLDNDLLIENLEAPADQEKEPSVELIDFYSACGISSPCHLQLPEGGNANLADITPSTAAIGALSDGSFVLYDGSAAATPVAKAEAPAGVNEGGALLGEATRPVLYGLGAAAVIGLAAGGGGGGGGGDSAVSNSPAPNSGDTPPPPPTSTPDGTFTILSPTLGKSGRPVLSGAGTPGGVVNLNIDTNGDGTDDVVYRTTVGTDGKWSADLASARPVSGALPAAGLTANSIIEASQTADGRVATLPEIKPTVDGTTPAAPTLNPIATDNIINAAEMREPIALSGTAEANSTINIQWGTRTFTTTAGADGQWTHNIPAGATPASSTSLPVNVTSTDAAGNVSAPVSRALGVDINIPGAPTIRATGGTDNYLSAAEKPNGTTVTGVSEANAKVSVTIGTTVQTVTADAGGQWSATFSAAQLPAADGRYQVAVSATDAAGNVSPVGRSDTLTIDTRPPAIEELRAGPNNFVRSGQQFRLSGETEGAATVVIDYYAGANATTYTTQRVNVGGAEGENDVDWASPVFTAPRSAQTQTHRMVISSTDKAGNMTVAEHIFTVFGSGLLLGDDSNTPPATLKQAGNPLNSQDLFDEAGVLNLAAAGSVLQASTLQASGTTADADADATTPASASSAAGGQEAAAAAGTEALAAAGAGADASAAPATPAPAPASASATDSVLTDAASGPNNGHAANAAGKADAASTTHAADAVDAAASADTADARNEAATTVSANTADAADTTGAKGTTGATEAPSFAAAADSTQVVNRLLSQDEFSTQAMLS
ncbi:MAG: Ig-like domain-containing protein [Lautropia sp.]|nr:Ig-like domain-containing protein [Lautropia sp.]